MKCRRRSGAVKDETTGVVDSWKQGSDCVVNNNFKIKLKIVKTRIRKPSFNQYHYCCAALMASATRSWAT